MNISSVIRDGEKLFTLQNPPKHATDRSRDHQQVKFNEQEAKHAIVLLADFIGVDHHTSLADLNLELQKAGIQNLPIIVEPEPVKDPEPEVEALAEKLEEVQASKKKTKKTA